MRGLAEGGIDRFRIADGPVVVEIAGNLRSEFGRSRRPGFLRCEHRRQGPVVHLNQFGSVQRRVRVFGDNHGHGLSRIAHRVVRQQRLGPVGEGNARPGVHPEGRVQRSEPVAGGSRRIQHRQYAARGLRARKIDARDPGMRMGRADQHGVRAAGKIHVVKERAPSGQQPRILAAQRAIPEYRARRMVGLIPYHDFLHRSSGLPGAARTVRPAGLPGDESRRCDICWRVYVTETGNPNARPDRKRDSGSVIPGPCRRAPDPNCGPRLRAFRTGCPVQA